ncbi:MAG: thiosulfate oxidation carrier protein SoxY [Gammaproteobacteria bacterium]|nr:thiosulfate oxidation carrier protein SoxY [Gammaproteobacteria bacterium]MDH5593592.1 thiosulfate oxidation carrier protein SoxY [Gammaproteobacteria bacterium]MDH5614818.1 thiosulfate oxidation carrier protein SoxY [Gammaproteobacteria bacterium]
MKRRLFLKGTLAGGAIAVAASAGLLIPTTVLAAWPKSAFDAKKVDDAINALAGTTSTTSSGKVKINAPEIAEVSAEVRITVDVEMDNVESISIIVENNPSPFTAHFEIPAGTLGYVSTRVKMAKTSNVIALVKSGGKLYSAQKEVKVTVGGCGG